MPGKPMKRAGLFYIYRLTSKTVCWFSANKTIADASSVIMFAGFRQNFKSIAGHQSSVM